MKYRYNDLPNEVIGVLNRVYQHTRSSVWKSYYTDNVLPRTIYEWMKFLDAAGDRERHDPITDIDQLILLPYMLGGTNED